MRFLKLFTVVSLFLSSLSTMAVSVSTPQNAATVQTTFPIAATATSCNGKPVVSMGYSFDSLPTVMAKAGQALNEEATISAGSHTLRIKAWGKGTVCVNDINLIVVKPPVSLIPSGNLTGNSLWKCQHDLGTSGSSTAVMTYPVTEGGYTDVQKYEVTSYSNYGGERCSINFAKDTSSHNFIYDVWIQVPTPSLVGNLELDMNQVTTNGNTVIYAFQCSKWSSTWDYSYVSNNGGALAPKWVPSKLPCNVKNWTANTWHHVQIYTSRDDLGSVTYHWVAFDGVVNEINTTTFEEQALKWAMGALVVNFQIDPAQSTGLPITVYARQLTIYRW